MNWILSQDVAGASTLLSSSSQTLLSQSSEDPAGLNLPPSPFPSSYKYKSVFFPGEQSKSSDSRLHQIPISLPSDMSTLAPGQPTGKNRFNLRIVSIKSFVQV